jgi:hypothetical protein
MTLWSCLAWSAAWIYPSSDLRKKVKKGIPHRGYRAFLSPWDLATKVRTEYGKPVIPQFYWFLKELADEKGGIFLLGGVRRWCWETGRKRSFGYELTMIIGFENVGMNVGIVYILLRIFQFTQVWSPAPPGETEKANDCRNDTSGFRLIAKLPNRNRLIPGVPPLVTAVWLSRGLV